jgi:glycerophosphoryl diester phosphodiesterase
MLSLRFSFINVNIIEGPMLILGHRGYHVHSPENSIQAIEDAIALGIDGVEIDIQLTKDDLPILFHERLTPDGREVHTLTLEEINLAVGFQVATLDEVLKLAQNTSTNFLWNFEIKTPMAVGPIIQKILPLSGSNRILLSSFWHSAVEELSLHPPFDCAIIVAHYPISFIPRPSWIPTQPNVNTVVWKFDRVDSKLISESKACGLKNFVYDPITPNDHTLLLDWGVDGVITDYPNLVPKII